MKIPLAAADIGPLERRAIIAVLKRGRLALGSAARRFETALATYVGRKFGVAVSSGTTALHLAVRAIGLKAGDEVITTPFSFVASANCLLYERVKPVFVDINPVTLCIDSAAVESTITHRTRAILAVDVFGHPADWPTLIAIARRHRLQLIEDACEALGSEVLLSTGKRRCGSFGTVAVFAFYPNKQITTGEGGMLVTDSVRIADSCRSMANQGRRSHNGRWLQHIRLGYNYRLDELSAALGLAQLRRLRQILHRRNLVARLYDRLLADIPEIQPPTASPGTRVHWFVYCIRLAPGINRDRVLQCLRNYGVECANYFPPIHLLPFYRAQFGFRPGDFPVTEDVARRTVALPFSSKLKEEQVFYVIECLKKTLRRI